MNRTAASLIGATFLAFACAAAQAAPATYVIDPSHTFPSFETDHLGGLSIWRGKFTKTSGKIVYDASAKTGTLEVTIDMASIDVGYEKLETRARADDILDVARFPTATYKGKLTKFKDAMPTEVEGELTLHGVTKPVKLTVTQFLCKVNPLTRKDVCGADATAVIDRKDFGVSFGEGMGFRMATKLLISVEAIKM